MILLLIFDQIKEQHRGDLMTAGPKSQLLSGIVVDTIKGPVSIFTICKTKVQNPWCGNTASCSVFGLCRGNCLL